MFPLVDRCFQSEIDIINYTTRGDTRGSYSSVENTCCITQKRFISIKTNLLLQLGTPTSAGEPKNKMQQSIKAVLFEALRHERQVQRFRRRQRSFFERSRCSRRTSLFPFFDCRKNWSRAEITNTKR